MAALRKISRRGWLLIGRWTLFGTGGCLAIATGFTWLSFRDLEPEFLRRVMVNSVALPILLAGPLFFYLTLKLRELAIANHKLASIAATDSLTGCLNRGAFVRRVEDWLAGTGGRRTDPEGAMLIIDADNFKAINDAFGHAHGDEALLVIARALRAVSRGGDIVGRLGGEEFGVFLPGAAAGPAVNVAERMRRTIEAAAFAPGGRSHRITVSIGCAAFDAPTAFHEIFKLADARLYRAKHDGRNRVCGSDIPVAGDGPAPRRVAL